MRPWLAVVVLALISLVVVYAPVAGAASYRPIMITFPQGASEGDGVVLSIPIAFVAGFQGLYISSTPDCRTPIDTWYATVYNYVVVVFRLPSSVPPNSTVTFYLCYGDIQYEPRMIFQMVGEGELTATATGVEDHVYKEYYEWETVYWGRPEIVDILVDFNETVYVKHAIFYFDVYHGSALPPTLTVQLLDDEGNILNSSTYSYTGIVRTNLSASDFTSRTIRVRYKVSGSYYYIYERTLTADIIRPSYAENSTTISGGSVWLIVFAGDSGYIKFDNVTLLASQGVVNSTRVGSYFYAIASPDGLGVWGPEGSFYDRTLSLSPSNVTIAATAYGVNVTSIVGYVAYDLPTTNYTYIVGGESQVEIPSPGTGNGTVPGNATVYVTVNVEDKTWRSVTIAAGFALFVAAGILVAYAFVKRGWEFYLASVLAGVSGGYLLSYAGLAREGMITSITILTLASLLFLVENIREVARWLGLR